MFSNVTFYPHTTLIERDFEPHKTYLLMAAQHYDTNTLPVVSATTTLFCITVPAVIWKATLYEDALICCELALNTRILFCEKECDALAKSLASCQSVLMFVDWMDTHIYRYLDRLFSLTGGDVTIMGAGCGRTDGKNLPIMTCNAEVLNGGFIVLLSPLSSRIGSSHGSAFHNGYYIAHTENSNQIVSINGEKAFDFYTKMLKQHFHEEVNEANIFSMGLKYPLGLGSMGTEQPLRIPSGVKDGHLIVAGPMEEESTLCLMRSTPQSLLVAHSIAVEGVRGGDKELSTQSCFMIECVGRRLVLESDFSQELEAIVRELGDACHHFGILSLGEIANSADKYIEYFNESCVIGLLDAAQ